MSATRYAVMGLRFAVNSQPLRGMMRRRSCRLKVVLILVLGEGMSKNRTKDKVRFVRGVREIIVRLPGAAPQIETSCRRVWRQLVRGRGCATVGEQSIDGLTVFHQDVPVACLVAWGHGPGHWSCGMIATDHWPKVAGSTSRYLKRYLRVVLLGQRVRRLSCVVDARYDVATRWLRFLGFEREGCLRRYGADGRDFQMFSCLPSTMTFWRTMCVAQSNPSARRLCVQKLRP